jgi:hypothetical protein
VRLPSSEGSTITNFLMADLEVTRISQISGPSQISSGFNLIFEVAVANAGAVTSSPVEVNISAGGSFQVSKVVSSADDFTCNGAAPVDCVGQVGGSEDSPANAALFQVQVYAASAGTGTITVAIDPKHAIPDRDRSNDTKTISVTVK